MRYAIELIRVSTEQQAASDRASIPAQRAVNQRTAQAHGLKIIKTIEIIDVSGAAVLKSPGMQELLRLIDDPEISGVVTRRDAEQGEGMSESATCPKCRRVQYFVCSNRACVCWRRIPRGKKPQRFMRDGERIACPYCRFKAHADYWEERSIQCFFRSLGVSSFREAEPIMEARRLARIAKTAEVLSKG